MKRKDTKVYENTVENYCYTRLVVEDRQKSIADSYEKIGRAKAMYDTLVNNNNEEIKKWYNCYTEMLRMNAGMSENLLEGEPEKLKCLASVLEEDYDEDVDKLYNEWRIKEHLKPIIKE